MAGDVIIRVNAIYLDRHYEVRRVVTDVGGIQLEAALFEMREMQLDITELGVPVPCLSWTCDTWPPR